MCVVLQITSAVLQYSSCYDVLQQRHATVQYSTVLVNGKVMYRNRIRAAWPTVRTTAMPCSASYVTDVPHRMSSQEMKVWLAYHD